MKKTIIVGTLVMLSTGAAAWNNYNQYDPAIRSYPSNQFNQFDPSIRSYPSNQFNQFNQFNSAPRMNNNSYQYDPAINMNPFDNTGRNPAAIKPPVYMPYNY